MSDRPTPSSSNVQARAKRLIYVRKMLGMTIASFAKKHGIGESTLRHWEKAHLNGLREAGAERIVAALKSEGIDCSLPWLLHGVGEAPKFVSSKSVSEMTEEEYMQHAINTFLSDSPDHAVIQLSDNTFSPIYLRHDYLGAKLQPVKALNLRPGEICIIKTETSKTICKKFTHDDHVEFAGRISRLWRLTRPNTLPD